MIWEKNIQRKFEITIHNFKREHNRVCLHPSHMWKEIDWKVRQTMEIVVGTYDEVLIGFRVIKIGKVCWTWQTINDYKPLNLVET